MMQLNRVSSGGLGQVFSRIFGLDEQNAVQTVAPEIMPTTSPWERDEFWALTGGNLCCGRTTTNGVGAQYSGSQLRNPSNSGMLLIVERIWGNSSSVQFLEVGANLHSALSTLPSSADSYHRDERRAPGNNPLRGIAGRLTYGTDAALIVPSQAMWITPGENLETWVIPPGWGIQVAILTVNTPLYCQWWWREKPVSSAEQLTY